MHLLYLTSNFVLRAKSALHKKGFVTAKKENSNQLEEERYRLCNAFFHLHTATFVFGKVHIYGHLSVMFSRETFEFYSAVHLIETSGNLPNCL